MHEMSLAEGVRSIVEDAARDQGFGRVTRVILEVGELSSVETEALRFCLDVVLKDSVADGAGVEVIETPGVGWCMACAESVALHQRYDPCPGCGGYQIQPTGGLELRVKELEIE